MASCISQKRSLHYLPFLRLNCSVTLTFFPSWNGICFSSPLLQVDLQLTWNICNILFRIQWREFPWLSRLDQKRHCGYCHAHWDTLPWSLQLPGKQTNCPEAQTSPSEKSHKQDPDTTESDRGPQPAPLCSSSSHTLKATSRVTPSRTHPVSPPVFLTHKKHVCTQGKVLKDIKGCA